VQRLDLVTAALRTIEADLYLEAEKGPAGSNAGALTIKGLAGALEKIKDLELGGALDARWTTALQQAAKRLLRREAKTASDLERPAALRIEQLIARRQRDQVGANLDLVWVMCSALGYSGVHDDAAYSALSRYLRAATDAGVARPAAYALARLDSDPRAQRLLGLALELHGATSPLLVQLESLTSRTRSELALDPPKTVEAHLRRGLLLRARGELGAASGLFKRASELDAKSAEAFGRFAEAQVALGNLKNAGQAADKALRLDAKCAVALLARGLARQRGGSLEPALQDLALLCDVDVDNPRSLSRRGLARLSFGDEEGAMSDFQGALLLDSGWGQAWLGRGQLKTAQGKLAAAAADLTQAVELGELEALGARGEVRRGLGDPNGSVADFSRALARSSKDSALWNGRGHSYLAQKNYDLAAKDFETANRLAPREAKYLGSLGKAYYDKGDLKKSANYYAKALEKDQQDPKLWSARGEALLSMGRPGVDRAIKDFDMAIELSPKDAELYQHRGLAYYVKGMGIDAVHDYNKAIELNPGRAEPYKLRAAIWLKERKFKQARDDYERAIKRAPRDAEALLNQAQVHMALKDVESAMGNFNRAMKARPFDGTPYLRRGQALQMQKRYTESLKDFSRALELDDRIKQAYYFRAASHAELKQMPKAMADLATFIKVTPAHPLLRNARALLAKLRRGK
jgi:tetratricopeptide (TPR) repeat protein